MPDSPSPKALRVARLCVAFIFFANGFIFANWVARIPEIEAQHGLSHSQLGTVLLMSSIGAFIAMPYAGWFIGRFGSQRMTHVCALLFAACAAGIGWMPTPWLLGGLFFLLGLSVGALDVAMNAQAVLVERHKGRPIMSSFHALFSVGTFAGALSGAFFVDQALPMGGHFVVVAGLMALPIAFMRPHLLPPAPRQGPRPRQALFQMPNQALAGLGLIAFCCMLAEGAMADWSALYAHRVLGAELARAPFAFAAFTGAMTLFRFAGDRLRLWLRDGNLLIISTLVALLGIGILLLAGQLWAGLLGFVLVGAGLATVVPIAYSAGGHAKDLPEGVGLAMVTTLGYAGFLVGPPVIGYLADAWSLRGAFVFIALLLTLATGLALRRKPMA